MRPYGMLFADTSEPSASSFGAIRDSLGPYLTLPVTWGILLTTCGLWLMLPRRGKSGRTCGALVTAAGIAMLAIQLRGLAGLSHQAAFWSLAAITLFSAVATITSHNPVYCAIWFALTLLGTATLFVIHGAQFVGVATVVVYAGAIVVTLLFVVMLAQPDGSAHYDRMSWGTVPTGVSALAGVTLAALVLISLMRLSGDGREQRRDSVLSALQHLAPHDFSSQEEDNLVRSVQVVHAVDSDRLSLTIKLAGSISSQTIADLNQSSQLVETLQRELPELQADVWTVRCLSEDVLDHQHTANLGGQLMARHLISLEVAGTLLLAALVGAVAIVVQGRQKLESSGAHADG